MSFKALFLSNISIYSHVNIHCPLYTNYSLAHYKTKDNMIDYLIHSSNYIHQLFLTFKNSAFGPHLKFLLYILTTNSRCFHTEHKAVGHCIVDLICCQCSSNWHFMCRVIPRLTPFHTYIVCFQAKYVKSSTENRSGEEVFDLVSC